MRSYDVVVIGGGHAGIEAASASARLGARTAMITMDLRAIGRMSCNPAIGGVAKGQLVRDLDALGGLMGLAADAAGIQFRMLNLSKGPAVWGPRAQMDMELYADVVQAMLRNTPGMDLIAGELSDFRRRREGFELGLSSGGAVGARGLVITSGTFLGAMMYTGLGATPGGRVGEPAAAKLSETLRREGLALRRLKTGTPARLAADSIEYGEVEVQHGDGEPFPFSFRTRHALKNRTVCWITHTNGETHDVLRAGFDRSPMFTGAIKGIGPRYCPSIEDKVCRFADKPSHHLFLEPEGLGNNRIYVNGFSSSLPAEIQDRALRTVPGLRHCRVIRYGYAVEYDAVDATRLHPTLECRDIPGLYFAGQVNGTSGYEEAACQGLVAGANAALKLKDAEPLLLARGESYIGVLIDDLVHFELDEPYRMFTSRAEYRLHLRQDNAEERLLEKGAAVGLVDGETRALYRRSRDRIESLRAGLAAERLSPEEANPALEARGLPGLSEKLPALDLLRRPGVDIGLVLELAGVRHGLDRRELLNLEASESYRGFWERQRREIERTRRLAELRIPHDFDYARAHSLSTEARQKLSRARPLTVGAAGRISGVTPADVSGLIFHLRPRSAEARRGAGTAVGP